MTTELWRSIPEWEHLYEVSNLGRVRSKDRINFDPNGRPYVRRGRIRKLFRPTKKWDYPRVTLCDKATDRFDVARVHILVMKAFVGPCPDGMQIRHLNGDSNDPRLENLAYGTPTENQLDTVRHGNHFWANKTHCPKNHPLSGENVYLYKGRRSCRICMRSAWRRYRERQRLARQAVPS